MYEGCEHGGCRLEVEAVQRTYALGANVSVLWQLGERDIHLVACPECSNPVALFEDQDGYACGYCGAEVLLDA